MPFMFHTLILPTRNRRNVIKGETHTKNACTQKHKRNQTRPTNAYTENVENKTQNYSIFQSWKTKTGVPIIQKLHTLLGLCDVVLKTLPLLLSGHIIRTFLLYLAMSQKSRLNNSGCTWLLHHWNCCFLCFALESSYHRHDNDNIIIITWRHKSFQLLSFSWVRVYLCVSVSAILLCCVEWIW